MTHIKPLWWSKAVDYIFLSFLPSACHRTTRVIASFVVKNVTPVFFRIFKSKHRKNGVYLSFRSNKTKVDGNTFLL